MMNKIAFLLIMILSVSFSFAQNAIEGVWFNTTKSGKVEIYESNDKFYGKIIWIDEPTFEDGTAKTDLNNPKEDKHDTPIIGLKVLKGFSDEGEGLYKGGTIYDPENGKTYKCKMTLDGDDLTVRGFIGISLMGRNEYWTRVN